MPLLCFTQEAFNERALGEHIMNAHTLDREEDLDKKKILDWLTFAVNTALIKTLVYTQTKLANFS